MRGRGGRTTGSQGPGLRRCGKDSALVHGSNEHPTLPIYPLNEDIVRKGERYGALLGADPASGSSASPQFSRSLPASLTLVGRCRFSKRIVLNTVLYYFRAKKQLNLHQRR